MFFRNLLLYRLTQAMKWDAQALQNALAEKPARACASQEIATYGFVAPIGKGEDAPLVHASAGFLLIAARKEERILPGSVVREALAEKIEEIEAAQCRKVYKKERDQLKDEIVQAFLPRAFIRRSITYAAIMPAEGLIVVDTASAKKAEDLLSTLREAIGSLPVRPLSVKIAPSATLTDWLKTQKAADDFYVLDECELRDTHEEGGVVRCKRQDMTGDEIQTHLGNGKQATQLSLAWKDKLSFVLDDKLSIRRLRFDDLLQEQAEQDGGDDALSQQDASFALMMLTFADFLPALIEALGGEEIPQGLGETPPAPAVSPAGQPSALQSRGMPAGVTVTLVRDGHPLADAEPGLGDATDPLYPEAVQWVRETRRASISAIQRKLCIGYNRAAGLIEAMTEQGIISAPNREGGRDVLV